MQFKWDDENKSHNTEISTEDVNRLKEKAKNVEKMLKNVKFN